MDINNVSVSICCQTYNHETFIKECLDGFVMQKTDFVFEILVHEDASTDNTAKILKEYEVKYPHLFRCVYQTENQFKKQNTLINILFPMARGKYIALCEGDDYWIDPLKLQKQVDFLEKNSKYNFSVSSYHTIDKKGRIEMGESFRKKTNNLLIRDYITKRFSQTSTFLFRNNLEFPSWFEEIYAGDQGIVLLVTKDKKIKYHNDVFSVYRLHRNGIDALNNNYAERNKKYIFLLENIKSLTEDWKCKVIISFKIHITLIRNYSLNTRFEIILKVYIGVINKIIIPIINKFLNWI
jgi:glycosyltransferase involved in cell wall biosynthesis